jgi:CyaY protein
MNSAEYTEIAESLYNQIEVILDHLIEAQQAPLDYENSSGVITIDCEDSDTKVIITRQQANQQIWVAAKSGGFHCVDNEGLWRCTKTGETLGTLLSRVCTEQSKGSVVFDGID